MELFSSDPITIPKMPVFTKAVRQQMYAFLTRSELNTFEAVCYQWSREIARQSHQLAILFPGSLHIDLCEYHYSESSMRFLRRAELRVDNQIDYSEIARRLAGERLFPIEDANRGVNLCLSLDKQKWDLNLYLRNQLSLEASIALLRVFS